MIVSCWAVGHCSLVWITVWRKQCVYTCCFTKSAYHKKCFHSTFFIWKCWALFMKYAVTNEHHDTVYINNTEYITANDAELELTLRICLVFSGVGSWMLLKPTTASILFKIFYILVMLHQVLIIVIFLKLHVMTFQLLNQLNLSMMMILWLVLIFQLLHLILFF